MSKTVLPPSANFHEIALEMAHAKRIESLPVPVRAIRRPYDSPEEFLPWLAWDNGVTWWDTTWTEQQQRDVINNARWVNQRRGTPGSIHRALESLNYSASLIEWFDDTPRAVPYSFRVVLNASPDANEIRHVEDMIMDAKNARSWFSEITINPEPSEGNAILAGWLRVEETAQLVQEFELVGVGVNDWMTADFSPSTSFAGAIYSLVVQGSIGGVRWVVSNGNANVNDAGDVTVTGPGSITVTATDGYGRTLSHTISPTLWFVQDGSTGIASDTTPEEWAASLDARLPAPEELISTTSSGRQMGFLYGEWGDLTAFGWGAAEITDSPRNKVPTAYINNLNQREMAWLCGTYAGRPGQISPSDITPYNRCCVVDIESATKSPAGRKKGKYRVK